MSFYTPFRYPGGKGKLAPFIQDIFKFNNLSDGTYVEPYAGGAAVAMTLLLEGYAWNIIINDIDRKVYALWWSILNNTDWLCKKINDTPVNMEMWQLQRNIYKNHAEYDLNAVGFSTFFLNRTNRSGILDGGVIGGKNQTGKFKIDARYNKKDLIARIKLIARYRDRIAIHNEDALLLMKKIYSSINQKTLIYFDPPYYEKGKLLYHNFYENDDHRELSYFIRKIKTPWLVTYDNVPEIKTMYNGERFSEFDIAYYAHLSRSRGQEIMFYKNLDLPSSPYARKSAKTLSFHPS